MDKRKLEYVKSVANSLADLNLEITRSQFVDGLNKSGHKSEYGSEFQQEGPGPGAHKLLSAAWHACTDAGEHGTAKNIAERILTNDKTAPWCD